MVVMFYVVIMVLKIGPKRSLASQKKYINVQLLARMDSFYKFSHNVG